MSDPSFSSPVSAMCRLTPARKGDHLQMLLSANDMEAVLGHEVMNGIETLEARIRTVCMDAIADGKDLLAFFRKFDVNKDGDITRGELASGLKHLGVSFDDFLDANEELDLFMRKIDRGLFANERNNKIDYQEFIKFIMSSGGFTSEAFQITKGIHRPLDLLFNQGRKLVGLFFGQQWNPCHKKVQEKVVKFYNNLRAAGENRFEIVYVPMDQDRRRFVDAYRHMPWLAIPFHQSERRHYLARKYFVTSCPRMVLLDVHGNLISYDVKNDIFDYYEKPWIAADSWFSGKVREVSNAGVAFY